MLYPTELRARQALTAQYPIASIERRRRGGELDRASDGREYTRRRSSTRHTPGEQRMSHVKDLIDQAVDRLGDDLERLSRTIHDNPELAYQEVKAAGWLTEFLSGQGLTVERGVGGIDTAFRATIETGAGPTIAIMCEYDALPAIGHACGHNAIATAGAGAGAALAAVRASLPKGRIQVIGTPAEEGGGGKVKLI